MAKIKKWPIALILIVVLSISAIWIGLNMRFPVRYLDVIQTHSGELDPSWILAVIMAESSFRPMALSRQGAQGLMQIMPATAEEIATLMGLYSFEPEHIWIPEVNIAMGSFYLNRLLTRYQGDLQLALAAYNAGQGNVNRWLLDPRFSSDGKTLNVIPFPETDTYLRRVMLNQRVYSFILTITRYIRR